MPPELTGRSLCAEYGYAAARWATAVVGILDAPTDPTTVTAWGLRIRVSGSALRGWCRAANTRAKPSLDFARMLRGVVLAGRLGWNPQNLLNITDDRTMKRLLLRSGFVGPVDGEWRPTAEKFLDRQQIVREPMNVRAVIDLLWDQSVVTPRWVYARLGPHVCPAPEQQPPLAPEWFACPSEMMLRTPGRLVRPASHPERGDTVHREKELTISRPEVGVTPPNRPGVPAKGSVTPRCGSFCTRGGADPSNGTTVALNVDLGSRKTLR